MMLHPIIVLDGPDGVGKTTLANHLCRELGAHYLHLTYRWPKKMFDYHTAALFFALNKAKTQPVIIDRWWPSEIVYANAYRGGSKWPLAYRMFEKAALRYGFTYVFCLPWNREAYLDFYNDLKSKRQEMYNSGMEKVYDNYVELYNSFSPSREAVYHYDFMVQGHELDKVCQDIIEVSQDYQRSIPGMINNTSFMNLSGNINSAKYVFVGDELKPKTRREVWPFFEYGNSSLFLANAFEQLNVPESDLAFINANHPDQEMTSLLSVILDLRDLKFISMGKTADNFLSNHGIEHGQMHHPQYYRRFKRDKILQDIKEVMK